MSLELTLSVPHRTGTHRTGTHRLWQAMRARRVFRFADLDELEICHPGSVRRYCQRLVVAGILGTDGRHPATLRLMRDLGPLAPVISASGGVRDPNVDPKRPYERTDPRAKAAAILDTLIRLPCWTCSLERDPARSCASCEFGGEDRERFHAAAERAAACVRRLQPRGRRREASHE